MKPKVLHPNHTGPEISRQEASSLVRMRWTCAFGHGCTFCEVPSEPLLGPECDMTNHGELNCESNLLDSL